MSFDKVHPELSLKRTPADTMMCGANLHGTLDQQTTCCKGPTIFPWIKLDYSCLLGLMH